MKLLGTIKHNDRTRNDSVSLYDNGTAYVWAKAADEDEYETDVPLEDVELAWGSDEWDLQLNANDDMERLAVLTRLDEFEE